MVDLTEEELRQTAAELDAVQTEYEKLQRFATPSMPCPECGGNGEISGGSLGDTCPTCLGERVVEAPGYAGGVIEMPDFAGMRALVTAHLGAFDAAQNKLGGAAPPALPAGDVVGVRDKLKSLRTEVRLKAGEILLQRGPEALLQLPAKKKRRKDDSGWQSEEEIRQVEAEDEEDEEDDEP